MAMSLTRYPPVDDETVLYTLPVSAPLMVIAAPETAAPVLSTTEPPIAPRSDCAADVPTRTRLRNPITSPAQMCRVLRILAPPEVKAEPESCRGPWQLASQHLRGAVLLE